MPVRGLKPALESGRWPSGFARLGISRPIDLLLHFPLRYEDESHVRTLNELKPNDSVQCQVQVILSKVVFRPRRMLVVQVEDHSGSGLLRFLYFKDAMRSFFAPGAKIRVLGQVRFSGLGEPEFIHPRVRKGWLDEDDLMRQPLVAVYPTTKGLSQTTIRKAVFEILSKDCPKEWLPHRFRREFKYIALEDAIRYLHQPSAPLNQETLEQAWNRIRLDELVAQQVALRSARRRRGRQRALVLCDEQGFVAKLLDKLPFSLTPGQQQAWREVENDLLRGLPTHRLIQGDVGSGKTVIAGLAAAKAIGSGLQVAVMAPTEILASQLASKFSDWFKPLGIEPLFIKGALPVAQRRDVLAKISGGQAHLVVGTHALIQKDIQFSRLGLAIVDEQHRFGVAQRIALADQLSGEDEMSCHILGMSATPIPRSLAMTFMADLDVSVIVDRPPGRQPIRTRLLAQSRRESLLPKLERFLQEGQAYWVCPVIEDQESAEKPLAALEQTMTWLLPIFGERLAVVHGRMKPEEKVSAMTRFVKGEARLLLATTVIEVGVDVPAARLIIIDHAERFGLAQLHQLRGRVGRGNGQSTCILLYNTPLSETAQARLKAVYETDDGFELARRDLDLRGPGELLGMRQSGEPGLRFSDLTRDSSLVEQAVFLGEKIVQDLENTPYSEFANLGFELMDRWTSQARNFLASG